MQTVTQPVGVRRRSGAAVLLALLMAVSASLSLRGQESPREKPAPDFVRDVAPILVARCTICHGAEKQESGLRLDERTGATKGGDSGPAWVAFESGNSELLRRVTSTDADLRMPPVDAGEALTAEQIATLKAWVDSGANWPENATASTASHWAYQPISDPQPPTTKNQNWGRGPIDAFILARLEQEGIAPSPEADRETLLRRLYLDLIGLVPTREEQAAFLNDHTEGAYERLVDRLLDSRHFGERWGRHWLDLARYADSNGYELDVPRPNAWRYRDWVIEAVNRDLPYNEFLIEQYAGDMLEEASIDQLAATGFHRMTLKNDETGINEEDFRHKEIVDRVNTTGSAVLGLTLSCAECHTHKYDPISITEYYQLYAFFEHAAEIDRMIAGTPAERAAFREQLSKHYTEWVTTQVRERMMEGFAKKGAKNSRASIDAAYEATKQQVAAHKLLLEIGANRWLKDAPADMKSAIDAPAGIANVLRPKESVKPHMRRSYDAYLVALPEMNTQIEEILTSLERFVGELGLSPELSAALLAVEEERTEEQQKLLADYFETVPKQRDDLAAKLKQMVTEERYLPNPYVMVLKEQPDDGRITHVLLRGDFKQHGDVVEAQTPAFLPGLEPRGERIDRLDLAHWLVDSSNPLTRRVAVNQIWAHLFGQGIVRTVDDFGVRGEKPSHPELLDWLAQEFRRLGWSRKQLIREIVLSSAYRQSSMRRLDLETRDPLNVLLARQGRFRVEAETVRDLFLSASGLLDRTLGGPTIYPPIPDSVRELAYKYKLHWPTSEGSSQFRRGLYVHLRRSNPFPSLVMFDAPEGTNCTAFRNRSNTPLQALTTLNDPVFVENAQALGRRVLLEGPSDVDARIDWLFSTCLVRRPQPEETEILAKLVGAELSAGARQEDTSVAFVGDYSSAAFETTETAAWVAAARAVLNLDEFLTRE